MDVEQIVGRVLVAAAVHRDVQDGDAAGAERALDLGDEAARVERVVEHVGELEVEGVVGERLRVEVAPDDERRGRGEVDADGVADADEAERRDLLAEARADAERAGGVGEELPPAVVAEERGEGPGEGVHLAVPVAGGPDAAEARVERLVELVAEVVLVGAEPRAAHADVRRGRGRGVRDGERDGRRWRGGGVGVEEEEGEEGDEEEEEGAGEVEVEAGLGVGGGRRGSARRVRGVRASVRWWWICFFSFRFIFVVRRELLGIKGWVPHSHSHAVALMLGTRHPSLLSVILFGVSICKSIYIASFPIDLSS